jgi:hypothetical protein
MTIRIKKVLTEVTKRCTEAKTRKRLKTCICGETSFENDGMKRRKTILQP